MSKRSTKMSKRSLDEEVCSTKLSKRSLDEDEKVCCKEGTVSKKRVGLQSVHFCALTLNGEILKLSNNVESNNLLFAFIRYHPNFPWKRFSDSVSSTDFEFVGILLGAPKYGIALNFLTALQKQLPTKFGVDTKNKFDWTLATGFFTKEIILGNPDSTFFDGNQLPQFLNLPTSNTLLQLENLNDWKSSVTIFCDKREEALCEFIWNSTSGVFQNQKVHTLLVSPEIFDFVTLKGTILKEEIVNISSELVKSFNEFKDLPDPENELGLLIPFLIESCFYKLYFFTEGTLKIEGPVSCNSSWSYSSLSRKGLISYNLKNSFSRDLFFEEKDGCYFLTFFP